MASFESQEQNVSSNESFPLIMDRDEALDFIDEQFKKGERPVVTVPEKYSKELQSGLKARATWIPNMEIIAGTFSRTPYHPNDGEQRIQMRVVDIDVEQIEPRFTGPNNAFQGVVVLEGPIAPEAMEVFA